jgi:hypothetical protein
VRGVPVGRLGDVHRQVSHALQVGVDLHGRDDSAQVGRHRLVQGEQLEAAVVDLDVQFVDRLVAIQHAPDQRDVAGRQSLDGGADTLLRQTTHFEQPALEHFELLLEMTYDALH